MKCMARNKVEFYYALYETRVPVFDEYGNPTGEYDVIHSYPIKYAANISSAQGEAITKMFGDNESYDKVIVVEQNSPNFDIHSVLWVDIIPELNDDGSLVTDDKGKIITPYDYIVKKVAKSLNSVTVAISKVNVSE